IFYRYILAIDIADLLEAAPKCFGTALVGIRGFAIQESNDWRRLLCARHQRHRCCCTTANDELPPPHSITSSARASNAAGIWMPSVLAVCRLIMNSNLVGSWTGISAGFSPLRMRPA